MKKKIYIIVEIFLFNLAIGNFDDKVIFEKKKTFLLINKSRLDEYQN